VRARYYDLASQRFAQEDPIGYAGGLNLYAYGSGNPTTGRDLSGMAMMADTGPCFICGVVCRTGRDGFALFEWAKDFGEEEVFRAAAAWTWANNLAGNSVTFSSDAERQTYINAKYMAGLAEDRVLLNMFAALEAGAIQIEIRGFPNPRTLLDDLLCETCGHFTGPAHYEIHLYIPSSPANTREEILVHELGHVAGIRQPYVYVPRDGPLLTGYWAIYYQNLFRAILGCGPTPYVEGERALVCQ
jgi:hypothetical protein